MGGIFAAPGGTAGSLNRFLFKPEMVLGCRAEPSLSTGVPPGSRAGRASRRVPAGRGMSDLADELVLESLGNCCRSGRVPSHSTAGLVRTSCADCDGLTLISTRARSKSFNSCKNQDLSQLLDRRKTNGRAQ